MGVGVIQARSEIDIQIAEKVMGWQRKDEPQQAVFIHCTWQDEQGKTHVRVPPFSTDIAAAWQVLEKIGGNAVLTHLAVWRCSFGSGTDSDYCDSAPLAICQAALQAVKQCKTWDRSAPTM